MADKDMSQVFWGHVNVLVGAVGDTPATPVGYTTEDGIEAAIEMENTEHYTDELKGPTLIKCVKNGLKVKGAMEQLSAETLALALGIAAVGQEVTMISTATEVYKSVKLVGYRHDGTMASLNILKAKATGNLNLSMKKKSASGLPFEFTAIEDASLTYFYKWLLGTGNIVATLSNNTLTRTAGEGYHQVEGQGAAADQLDFIAGASLVNGEILRLQPYNASHAITVAHETTGAGKITLVPAVNWVMNNVNDYIDLQYNLANTKWNEIARHDAR